LEIETTASTIYTIKVRPDPLFGPVIEIIVSESRTVLRITPLTDRDIEEIIQEIHIDKNNGICQILGRLSQMIEEIPWLWSFEAKAVLDNKPILISDSLISIKTGGAERPSY
jgi:hypothetical protein